MLLYRYYSENTKSRVRIKNENKTKFQKFEYLKPNPSYFSDTWRFKSKPVC